MKIEISYDNFSLTSFASHPPKHRTPLHFWGDPEGVRYPYVVEMSEEEWQRIAKAFEEYRWAQGRLREIIDPLPLPTKCGCGNCAA